MTHSTQTTANIFTKVGYLGGATFDSPAEAQAWAESLRPSYGPVFRAEYSHYQATPDGGAEQIYNRTTP